MMEYICHIAQNGFYAGPVHAVNTSTPDIEKTASDCAEETAKLDRAIDAIKNSMTNAKYSGNNAAIMETVQMLLDDQSFMGEIKEYITNENCTAEYAVKNKADEYARKMETAESEYLRARASDIRGVGEQIIKAISGNTDAELVIRSALVSYDISPAQMTSFDQMLIGGIITDKGSPNSHLSILAGNLEIPYVYGNTEATAAAMKSKYVIIDGEKLIIDPDSDMIAEAEKRMTVIADEKIQRRKSKKDIRCKTKIYANIAGPEDIPQLLESGADGVGLFRSEFLFLGSNSAPDEEEQYQAYSAVLDAMGDKEVIIRTMDIGSDKKVRWLDIPEEANPALGLRGVRISLEKKELFHTQLRAMLRAGVHGNLKIMFPMITSEWEIDEITNHVNEAAAELEKEKVPYRIPEPGIMIETPAAAIISDTLSKKVGFFSIGTNDLTQYTLALDREEEGLDRYFTPHHEAVLRLIEQIVHAGHANGVTTGICGQLAADTEMIERLIEAGVDELSVPVSKVRQIRECTAKAEKNIEDKKNGLKPGAPADGELIPMQEIPDPVFSSGKLGKCIGILPENGNIWSPCDGTVVSIAETKHAITIKADNGEEFLVHVGIDTVKLGGKGFMVLVSEGDYIGKSQKIMTADLDVIRGAGLSTMVIICKLE